MHPRARLGILAGISVLLVSGCSSIHLTPVEEGANIEGTIYNAATHTRKCASILVELDFGASPEQKISLRHTHGAVEFSRTRKNGVDSVELVFTGSQPKVIIVEGRATAAVANSAGETLKLSGSTFGVDGKINHMTACS